MFKEKRKVILSWLLILTLILTSTGYVYAAPAPKEYKADVIVVGGGGAGIMAAIEAADKGGKVILIEKLDKLGGSLQITPGTLSGAGTEIQKKQGIVDDLESYFMDITREGKFANMASLTWLYVNNAAKMVDWLVNNGLQVPKGAVFAPEHTLYSIARSYKPVAPQGYVSGALAVIEKQLAQRKDKIQIFTNTTAVSLIKNKSGRIVSVLAKDKNNREIKFTASKGVIMATGGYAANPQLMKQYNPEAANFITAGLPSADGAGIVMMQKIGAGITTDLMGEIPSYPMGFETKPGQGSMFTTKTQTMGGIQINLNGKRFVDETATNVVREEALPKQPQGVMFEIFDEEIKNATVADEFYGNMLRAALAKNAYLVKADTIEDLAKLIKVDAKLLKETINSYNEYVATGKDPEFGRTKLPRKIEKAPFYAARIKPIALITNGGVKVNTKLQVLGLNDKPIPGLYAAGECVGGLWGEYPSSGTGVTGALVLGKLSGASVMSTEAAQAEPKKPAAEATSGATKK